MQILIRILIFTVFKTDLDFWWFIRFPHNLSYHQKYTLFAHQIFFASLGPPNLLKSFRPPSVLHLFNHHFFEFARRTFLGFGGRSPPCFLGIWFFFFGEFARRTLLGCFFLSGGTAGGLGGAAPQGGRGRPFFFEFARRTLLGCFFLSGGTAGGLGGAAPQGGRGRPFFFEFARRTLLGFFFVRGDRGWSGGRSPPGGPGQAVFFFEFVRRT